MARVKNTSEVTEKVNSSTKSNTVEKRYGIELGMPEKIPTPADLALLRSFEPKG